VQPDAGFCAFVWGALLLADRPGAWGWRRVLGITVLGLAALAFRLAALPLVPALALFALLHRRELGWRPLVPVLIWGACGAVALAAVPGALTFATLVPRDPIVLARGVIAAAQLYPFAVLELFLYPLPWNRANDLYHLVIAAFCVVGVAQWVRRELTRLLTLFALAYVAMLLLLPMQDSRYLMPLAPLALYGAASGIAIVVRWFARQRRREVSERRAQRAALAAIAALVAVTLTHELTRPTPAVLMESDGVRPLFARLEAARAAEPIRALFVNPRVLTWRTGIPAMGFFLASPDTTVAELRDRRITHVVVGDVGTDELRDGAIRRAVASRPDAFRPLFTEGVFTVYAFDSARAGAAP
jgi:hypothetical protein